MEFILFLIKIIFLELFSDKMGSFNKIGLHFDLPWSFKKNEGEIRFISQFFTSDQYKNIELVKLK